MLLPPAAKQHVLAGRSFCPVEGFPGTLIRSRSAAHRVMQRAQALLLAANGVSNSEISEVVGVSRPTVLAWRGQ
jgi:hypothetical protein